MQFRPLHVSLGARHVHCTSTRAARGAIIQLARNKIISATLNIWVAFGEIQNMYIPYCIEFVPFRMRRILQDLWESRAAMT